jgi:hypothetical protein
MFSLTTILPIQVLLSLAFSATTVGRESSPTGSVLDELPQVPGVAGSSAQGIVPRRFAAIDLRSAGSQTRTVSGLGKCDERGHRRRAGSNDVVAVIACHDHQLKIAVVAVGPAIQFAFMILTPRASSLAPALDFLQSLVER